MRVSRAHRERLAAALVCVRAALDAGLRFRVAVQAPLDELDFALDFGELGVFLPFVDGGGQDQT